jgi:hypothetical protein
MVRAINLNSSLVNLSMNMTLDLNLVVEMTEVLYLKCLITLDAVCFHSSPGSCVRSILPLETDSFFPSPNSISKPQALVMNKKL